MVSTDRQGRHGTPGGSAGKKMAAQESRRGPHEDEEDRRDIWATRQTVSRPGLFNDRSVRRQGCRRIAGLNVSASSWPRRRLGIRSTRTRDRKIAVYDLRRHFDISVSKSRVATALNSGFRHRSSLARRYDDAQSDLTAQRYRRWSTTPRIDARCPSAISITEMSRCAARS